MEKKQNKKVKAPIIILIIGLLLGISLITIGVLEQNKGKEKESQESIQEKLDLEKKNLEGKRQELEKEIENGLSKEKENLEEKRENLEKKGIKYSTFATYNDGEKYDLKIITEALDPSFNYCSFDEYKGNDLTSTYCSLSNQTDDNSKKLNTINSVLSSPVSLCNLDVYKNNDLTSTYCSYQQKLNSYTNLTKPNTTIKSMPFYLFGGFIIIVSFIIATISYVIAKRKDIVSYTLEQAKPLYEEGMKMAEKIKEENLPALCPHCGAPTNKKIVCEYCGCKIVE